MSFEFQDEYNIIQNKSQSEFDILLSKIINNLHCCNKEFVNVNFLCKRVIIWGGVFEPIISVQKNIRQKKRDHKQ